MRTEDQIVTMSPVKVRLGTTDHDIKPLAMTANGLWRNKLADVMKPILESFEGELSAISYANAYGIALRESPDSFLSLLCDYAPNLEIEKIKAAASDEQVAFAFTSVMEVAFPFQKPLEMVKRLTASRSQ